MILWILFKNTVGLSVVLNTYFLAEVTIRNGFQQGDK